MLFLMLYTVQSQDQPQRDSEAGQAPSCGHDQLSIFHNRMFGANGEPREEKDSDCTGTVRSPLLGARNDLYKGIQRLGFPSESKS